MFKSLTIGQRIGLGYAAVLLLLAALAIIACTAVDSVLGCAEKTATADKLVTTIGQMDTAHQIALHNPRLISDAARRLPRGIRNVSSPSSAGSLAYNVSAYVSCMIDPLPTQHSKAYADVSPRECQARITAIPITDHHFLAATPKEFVPARRSISGGDLEERREIRPVTPHPIPAIPRLWDPQHSGAACGGHGTLSV